MVRKTNLLLAIAALLLELLPYGAVLYFGDADGSGIISYYSYFNPVPYGYANIGPLLCAVATVVLLILYIFNMKFDRIELKLAEITVSGLGSVFALLPFLMLGFKYVTVIGFFVFFLLFANTLAHIMRH